MQEEKNIFFFFYLPAQPNMIQECFHEKQFHPVVNLIYVYEPDFVRLAAMNSFFLNAMH